MFIWTDYDKKKKKKKKKNRTDCRISIFKRLLIVFGKKKTQTTTANSGSGRN